jgi:hypothetical protein
MDHDRIEAIQELGGEEGILLPMLKHVICRKAGDMGNSHLSSNQSLPDLHDGVTFWVHPGYPIPFSG